MNRSGLVFSHLGNAARRVPEASNIDAAFVVIDAINDSIRANDNFADGWVGELGNNSAHLRKVGQPLRVANEKLTELNRALRRISRDVTNYAPEVPAGGR